ncbi:gag-pol polyprotein [Hordeum vulgare]|nr:gag-pol polyprotein [Hordeum vulgare]
MMLRGPRRPEAYRRGSKQWSSKSSSANGMVERGLNANHMMITEFTNKHKIDANDIGKHLSRLYDRIDHLQAQIYDLQNQNCEDDTSTLVYANIDEFDATKNIIDAKMNAQMEELKVLIQNRKRDFKAYSPLYMQHLHRQASQDCAQEKILKLKSATSASYYDFDTDYKIHLYGTDDPEEYLEWERKMDTYLKLLHIPSEYQVKCATRNFHDYGSTWWLHTPSRSFDMSWSKTNKAMP